MIIIGSYEGMPFMNPLVLLADHPIILWPLPWIGDIGMFIILFGIQLWVATAIKNKNIRQCVVYFFILIALQIASFCFQQDTSKRMPGVSIIIPWWYQKGDGMFCGYRLSHDISKEVHNKKLLPKIILTPESTFCFNLEEYKNFIPIWCESANNVPIFLAGHSYKNDITHNCVFLLHNNKIVYQYFKQHSMPFLERSLWFEKILWSPILSSELIADNIDGIDKNNKEDRIQIENQFYQLFLCSEFFFETKRVSGQPILLLWNDTWLCCDYAKKLAELFMKYFEKKYTVPVYHLATSGLTNIKAV
jgi:apolipoprotein N-acyltransferase